MSNEEHTFVLTLRVDGKTVASREVRFTEYNKNVIYSLPLNDIMKDCASRIEKGLKDVSVDKAYRLVTY